MNSQKHILSILVQNEFGVLARIASMFAGRGYNIDSLSVAPTRDPKFSQMTIVTHGSSAIIEQILKQLRRLIDVVKVSDFTGEQFVQRETVLAKIGLRAPNLIEPLLEAISGYQTSKVDQTAHSVTLQITDEGSKIGDFLKTVEPYGILDWVSTGTIAIEKGERQNG